MSWLQFDCWFDNTSDKDGAENETVFVMNVVVKTEFFNKQKLFIYDCIKQEGPRIAHCTEHLYGDLPMNLSHCFSFRAVDIGSDGLPTAHA